MAILDPRAVAASLNTGVVAERRSLQRSAPLRAAFVATMAAVGLTGIVAGHAIKGPVGAPAPALERQDTAYNFDFSGLARSISDDVEKARVGNVAEDEYGRYVTLEATDHADGSRKVVTQNFLKENGRFTGTTTIDVDVYRKDETGLWTVVGAGFRDPETQRDFSYEESPEERAWHRMAHDAPRPRPQRVEYALTPVPEIEPEMGPVPVIELDGIEPRKVSAIDVQAWRQQRLAQVQEPAADLPGLVMR